MQITKLMREQRRTFSVGAWRLGQMISEGCGAFLARMRWFINLAEEDSMNLRARYRAYLVSKVIQRVSLAAVLVSTAANILWIVLIRFYNIPRCSSPSSALR
jgi:hypothetical protein